MLTLHGGGFGDTRVNPLGSSARDSAGGRAGVTTQEFYLYNTSIWDSSCAPQYIWLNQTEAYLPIPPCLRGLHCSEKMRAGIRGLMQAGFRCFGVRNNAKRACGNTVYLCPLKKP